MMMNYLEPLQTASGVVFIDFQKAFDCVNHTVLMDKLHSIGISGSFYDWLLNYLKNPKQLVTVIGSNSESLEISLASKTVLEEIRMP